MPPLESYWGPSIMEVQSPLSNHQAHVRNTYGSYLSIFRIITFSGMQDLLKKKHKLQHISVQKTSNSCVFENQNFHSIRENKHTCFTNAQNAYDT